MASRTRALLYAIFALTVGGAAYLLGVGSFLGQRAEASVLDASAFQADPAGPLRFVSIPNTIIALAVIGLIALWVHGIARTLTILVCSVTAIVACQVLKKFWLDRPQLLEFNADNSFPSGHMTVFVVLIGALIWALPIGARAVTMVASVLLLGVVSFQLLEYGWHRPSDLLGAQALAIFALALAAWLGPRGSRRRAGRSTPVFATLARIMSVALLVIGILLVLVALALVAFAAWTHSDALMLTAGQLGLVGSSALTVRILAKLSP